MSAASPDVIALSPRVTQIICEAAEIARASGALDGHVADNGIATAANLMPPTPQSSLWMEQCQWTERGPLVAPEAAKPGIQQFSPFNNDGFVLHLIFTLN